MIKTAIVLIVVSDLVGHVTFLPSAFTSRKYLTGFSFAMTFYFSRPVVLADLSFVSLSFISLLGMNRAAIWRFCGSLFQGIIGFYPKKFLITRSFWLFIFPFGRSERLNSCLILPFQNRVPSGVNLVHALARRRMREAVIECFCVRIVIHIDSNIFHHCDKMIY